eukprot:gene13648-15038_t
MIGNIAANQVIVPPMVVNRNGVRLSLRSEPFCHCTQTIDFARDGGVQSGDYIEYYVNGSRVAWEWCINKAFINFGLHTSQKHQEIKVKYLTSGTIFSSGSLVAEMEYTLRNPVSSFQISPESVNIQENITVRYTFDPVPQFCRVVAKFENIQVSSHVISSPIGECIIQSPRIPGILEISCVTATHDKLTSKTVVVGDSFNRSHVFISFTGHPYNNRILTIRPGQRFEVFTKGVVLNQRDEVVVVKASVPNNSSQLFEKPSNVELEIAIRVTRIDTGPVSFQLTEEGIYHVCLALTYEQHRLLGDWCTVIVSERAGSINVPLLEHQKSNESTAHANTSSEFLKEMKKDHSHSSPSFICCICQDKTVTMKFSPCNHVCTCQQCCEAIFSEEYQRRGKTCPICQQRVDGREKVFLV